MAGRPKKSETEKRSVPLPPVRVTPAEGTRLRADAARAGYSGKLSDYRRQCYFKGAPAPDMDGMTVDDVMRNIADLNRIRSGKISNAEFVEIFERVVQRHLAVIKSGL